MKTRLFVILALISLVWVPFTSLRAQGGTPTVTGVLGYGDTLNGEIKKTGSAGAAIYVFPGVKGDTITITVTAVSKGFVPQVVLARMINNKADKLATGVKGVIADFEVPEEDMYFILVYGDKNVGKFSISLESGAGDTSAEATPTESSGDSGNDGGTISGGDTGSGDSGRIIYTSAQGGNWQIYSVNPDGSDSQTLTTDGNAFSPVWSPDQTQIAYVLQTSGGSALYVMDADGSNAHRLDKKANQDQSVDWSPDGKKLVVAVGSAWNTCDLYVLNVDGSGRKLLAKTGAAGSDPSWSSDGKVVFFNHYQGNMTSVYVVDAKGGTPSKLLDNARDARFSPDGKTLAMAMYQKGNWDLYLLKDGSKTPVPLTKTRQQEAHPTWSPDGTQIAFMQSADNGQTWSVQVISVDGGDVTELAAVNSLGNDWSPN